MDQKEAHAVPSQHLASYRSRPYADLAALANADHNETSEVVAPSGIHYQIEIQFFWDHYQGGNVRVIGGIDAVGIEAYLPMTESFILDPAGRFVGE